MKLNRFNELLALFTLTLVLLFPISLAGLVGVFILGVLWYTTGENEYYRGYQDGLTRKYEKETRL